MHSGSPRRGGGAGAAPAELGLFGGLGVWSLSRLGVGMPEAWTEGVVVVKSWLGGTHSQGGDFLSKQPLILAPERIPLP